MKISIRKKDKGVTLIEALVYCVITGLVFTGIYSVFYSAQKNYYTTRAGIEVQRASLSTTNALCKELSESALGSIYLYAPTGLPPSAYPGIVFMSPRDENGNISINTGTGAPYWNKYVAYYLNTDPEDSSSFAIFRKEKTVTQTDTPVVSLTYTTTYFATGGGSVLPAKVLAHKVESFDIYWDTASYATPTQNPVYIKISAKDSSTGKDTTFETTTSVDVLN